MNNSQIMEILVDWNLWGNFDVDCIIRPNYIKRITQLVSPKKATIVKGIRRAGKSYLVYSFLLSQLNKNNRIKGKSETLIINCEDPRLFNIEAKDLLKIYDVYMEEVCIGEEPYVLIDEIQNVRRWEKAVHYLIETKKVKLIITGSSSKLLSDEYASTIGGRYIALNVLPLSFKEILIFKGIIELNEINEIGLIQDLTILKKKRQIKKSLKEFMQFGGFPEVVLEKNIQKRKLILLNYIQTIISKDLSIRYEIRNIVKLTEMIKLFLTNIATLQSINKISKTLKLSNETAMNYTKYLQNVGLLYFLSKIDFSLKKQILANKKVYCIDTGIAMQYSFNFIEKFGRYLENMVAIELIRRYGESNVYYWKDSNQHEIDFVVYKNSKVITLIQVTFDLTDDKTKNREYRSLLFANRHFNCKKLEIITWDNEFEEKFDGINIKVFAFWKWALQ
ncbi:MAG: ATP-binding protein [Candidatus Lokiarchaeota archaeon]|nr:ATP-binding protein [Candidatus Harpocratesius repetitus]